MKTGVTNRYILVASIAIMALLMLLMIFFIREPTGRYVEAPVARQRIYSIHETIHPGADYVTLTVRTGLDTLDVWIQQGNCRDLFGMIVSTGESQRVWELRYRPRQSSPYVILINANQSYSIDEFVVSQFFQVSGNPNTATQRSLQSALPGRDPTRQYTVNWHGVTVQGNGHFVDRTILALEFLDRGPEWGYRYVVDFLNYIIQCVPIEGRNIGARVNVRTRRAYILPVSYNQGHIEWYASILVHEGVHVRQFRDVQAAGRRWLPNFEARFAVETEAMTIQYNYLVDARVPAHITDMARGFIGTVWWE